MTDLDQALETAVTRHFGQLFEVLLVGMLKDPDDAMQRFKAGLSLTIKTEKQVAEVIRKIE